jgi:hypothetical protein
MTPGDRYRTKAAEIGTRAKREANLKTRAELEHLARAYLRLAEQAQRNAETDIVYGHALYPGKASEGKEPV